MGRGDVQSCALLITEPLQPLWLCLFILPVNKEKAQTPVEKRITARSSCPAGAEHAQRRAAQRVGWLCTLRPDALCSMPTTKHSLFSISWAILTDKRTPRSSSFLICNLVVEIKSFLHNVQTTLARRRHPVHLYFPPSFFRCGVKSALQPITPPSIPREQVFPSFQSL